MKNQSNNISKNVILMSIIILQIVSIALFVVLGEDMYTYNFIIFVISFILTMFYKYILLNKLYYYIIKINIVLILCITYIFFNHIWYISFLILVVLSNGLNFKDEKILS